LRNNYISLLSDLCACVHVKKKWRRKGSHSSSVSVSKSPRVTSNLEKIDGLVHCSVKNAAFCAKTIVKKSRKFELARLKKKKKSVW